MASPTPEPDPGYARPASQEDEIDLRAYWRVAVRRRWVIASVFAAAVLATLLITLRQTKIYAATATLIIDLSAPRVLSKEDVQEVVESGAGSFWLSKEYYETQYKVISSRAVAQRVVEKLQLARDLRFLGLDREKDVAKVEAALAKLDPAAVLQDRLKALPVKDSRVVRIQVEDRDPTWAATIANAVAEAYITENLSVRSSTTQNASDWLETQLADLERKLDESGKALFDFKRANDIVATSWEDRQSMVSQRLATTNDALTKARVRKAELQARNEAIEALGSAVDDGGPQVESLPAVAGSQPIQQLKVRYLDARAECADLRVRYLDDHPKLEACEKKLTVSRQALEQEIRTALEAARREYQEVVKTERNLLALLNETKSDAFGLNQHERDYLELKRAYDNNQRLYELVLKRLKDTGVTSMLQASNVRILDRARPGGRPVRPSPTRNLALAVVIGLLGGVGLAIVLEQLDRTFVTREQVEDGLGLAFLGVVPTIEPGEPDAKRDLFVHSNPKSAAAECLRSIRTNLLFMSPEKPLKSILITSSGPSEGKTTVAVSLAEIMADGGNRVLLVDADMRRPRVHQVFGVATEAGLSSVIMGGTLEETIRPTAIPNLWVLPCGPVPPNPSELLHATAFGRLLETLGGRFDRIIIDSPPAGVVADAVVIATQVDATLMVLNASRTARDAALRSVRAMRDVNVRMCGAVLNDLDLADERYGQYNQYYRYGYGSPEQPDHARTS
jgi:succinoglycan biosynthesis transport protein ExoP